jgi:hypothetical protein
LLRSTEPLVICRGRFLSSFFNMNELMNGENGFSYESGQSQILQVQTSQLLYGTKI